MEHIVFDSALSLPADYRAVRVPSFAANQGALRLQLIDSLVGKAAKAELVNRFPRYEVDPSLVESLLLEGESIDEKGEIPALSPERWLRREENEARNWQKRRLEFEEKGLLLQGILLEDANRNRLVAFIKANKVSSSIGPWDLVEIADHFLFMDYLNLVMATRPRV